MSSVLEGVRVVDLSSGIAGAVTTMLLADYGADVVLVEPPGGDRFRAFPRFDVWLRNKRSVTLDVAAPADREALLSLVATADVVVDSFAPGEAEQLGLDATTLRAANPRLVHLSITGYGRNTNLAGRPAVDSLVAARSGAQFEQVGLRNGPIAFHLPLPSLGAAVVGAIAVSAALYERELSGQGQAVETSLLQGLQAWTVLPHSRATTPPQGFYRLSECDHVVGTPTYKAADAWIHPMPEVAATVVSALGLPPDHIEQEFVRDATDFCERTARFQQGLQHLLEQWPAQRWVETFTAADVRCQLVGPTEEGFDHPQVRANDVVAEVDSPSYGRVEQYAFPYKLFAHSRTTPLRPAPAPGAHTDEVLSAVRGATAPTAGPVRRTVQRPLEGIKVLDFGLALAGPFGPATLGDLGADVIRVDNIRLPRSADDQVWAACQRSKRSISLDLKTIEGQEIIQKLVREADVIHHNMRPGVAERLNIGYEQVRAVNPRIVYAHVTGFGTRGPLVAAPGCDQMAQAIVGLDHEQGATPNGGHPTWNNHGFTDHATALLSIVGVTQALYERETTGVGQLVECDIVSAATFLASGAFRKAGSKELVYQHLDLDQTGYGPLNRLYETADGWLSIAALWDEDWAALQRALPDVTELGDARFSTADRRRANREELAKVLSVVFASGPAAAWFDVLDGAGVPCEIADRQFLRSRLYDDATFVAAGMVGVTEHPRWGRVEQHGTFFSFSRTPVAVERPPVVPGFHSREIMRGLGYDDAWIDDVAGKKAALVVDK